MQKGTFVVIDGNDGSGKATQSRLLTERLIKEGIATEKIDFPRYGVPFFGELLGECLAGKHGDFAHLDPKIASTLYALDRFEASPQIREWLEEGKVVVSDRFTSANQIHQGGKIVDGGKREAFLAWLDQMEHGVLNLPRPNGVVYLKVPIKTSLELLAKQRETKNAAVEGEQKDTVEKDQMYLERSAESAEVLASSQKTWTVVECVQDGAMRTPEDIHEEVYAAVKKLLG